MVQECMLVDIIVVTLEIQEEVPGTMLAAQLKQDLIILEFMVNQDNISTSVVLEPGLDQIDQPQEDIQEEKPDSDMLDRVQSMHHGDQIVQSELVLGETDLETVLLLHASILRMIDMDHGGSVTSKEPTISD